MYGRTLALPRNSHVGGGGGSAHFRTNESFFEVSVNGPRCLRSFGVFANLPTPNLEEEGGKGCEMTDADAEADIHHLLKINQLY